MVKILKDFIPNMDKHNWFRMLVCFTPGLVLGKLVRSSESPPLQIASSLVLVAGVSIYLGWKWLRERFTGGTEVALAEGAETQGSPPDEGNGEHQDATMAALIEMCNGRADVAIRLVSTEIAMSKVTYGEAILRAYDRRLYESKKDNAPN